MATIKLPNSDQFDTMNGHLANIVSTATDAIGNRAYTEDNYVTDSETITSSINALDMAVKDNSDDIAQNTADIADIESVNGLVKGNGAGVYAAATVADLPEPEADTNMTLVNGWANSSTSTYGFARYYKDRNRVYLEGFITGASATADTLFTLPTGYRPAKSIVVYILDSGGVFKGIIITAAGVITCTSRAVASLCSISFRIA